MDIELGSQEVSLGSYNPKANALYKTLKQIHYIDLGYGGWEGMAILLPIWHCKQTDIISACLWNIQKAWQIMGWKHPRLFPCSECGQPGTHKISEFVAN